jgi:hypothetical protein
MHGTPDDVDAASHYPMEPAAVDTIADSPPGSSRGPNGRLHFKR